ncbi:hypothetical protein UlMin_006936 [Ulmus minor]
MLVMILVLHQFNLFFMTTLCPTSFTTITCQLLGALSEFCLLLNFFGFQVKLDKIVNPNKEVLDYRTEITGMTTTDFDGVTCLLADIQKSMKKLLSKGYILVGHSLSNDLQALNIDHAWVIDTSFIFKYSGGPINRRPSLNNLCKVQKLGAPHNCLDDALAAMKLVLARIERQVNDILLHRIPKKVLLINNGFASCSFIFSLFHSLTNYNIDYVGYYNKRSKQPNIVFIIISKQKIIMYQLLSIF